MRMTNRMARRRWWAGLFTLVLLAGVALLAVAPSGSARAGGTEDDGIDGGGTPQEGVFQKNVRTFIDGTESWVYACRGDILGDGTVGWICASHGPTVVWWGLRLPFPEEPTIDDHNCQLQGRDDCRGSRLPPPNDSDDGDGDAQPESGEDPSVLIVETLTEQEYWYAIHWGSAYYQAQRQAYVYDPYYGRLVPTDDPWGGRTFSSDDPYAR